MVQISNSHSQVQADKIQVAKAQAVNKIAANTPEISEKSANPAQASDQLSLTKPKSGGAVFDVLSLNTWGLPEPISKEVSERHSRIGKSIASYEIAGFEEAFSAKSKHIAQGAALTGLSYHINKPDARRIMPSGLATFSQYEIVKSGFKPFSLGTQSDALAQKGVSFSRIRVPEGGLVDVYVTHFQATNAKPGGMLDQAWRKGVSQILPGFDKPASEIRAHDAQVLIDYVKANDEGHPVIIMGDFNTLDTQPVYQQIKQGLGLNDSFRELNPTAPGYTSDGIANPWKVDTDKQKRVDYIFYRSGQDTDLKALSSELAFNQAVDGKFVSDHFGLHTRFEMSPKRPTTP